MPLRVAMPKSVMNPIMDATLSTPPDEEHAGDAADERERQVQHDEPRVARPAKRQHEQHEQAGRRPCHRGAAAAATRSARSRTDRRTPRDSPAASGLVRATADRIVVDDAAEVASGDVRGDHDSALHVFAQHHVRPLLAADVGEESDRHAHRRWACRSGRSAEPLEVGLGRRDRTSRPDRTPSRGRRFVPTVAPANAVSTASATSSARRP